VNRTLGWVVVVLIAALAVAGALAGEEEEAEPASDRGAEPALSVERIARRVERIRELEFEHLPRVKHVSREQAARAALRELDLSLSPAEQRGQERLLQLLGLMPPDMGLRDLLNAVFRSEIGGYYSPRSGELALVRDSGLGAFSEVAVAHELTHALEDQRFGLEPAGELSDRAAADSALHEGTATLVMVDYLITGGGRDLPDSIRAEALEALQDASLPASSGLPRYFRESLVFPYAAGARFVDRLHGQGGWRAVDRAFGAAGPRSTEQILHPAKYERGEAPERVRAAPYRSALPSGARLALRGDLGEFDTEQLLREGNGAERSERAAEGWGGSSLQLWRLPGGGCEPPCRERHVLAMVWAWDSDRDAREFERAAERSLAELSAAGAVERGPARRVAFVLAPSRRLAAEVARRAAGRGPAGESRVLDAPAG
jgi:hypothetical protein